MIQPDGWDLNGIKSTLQLFIDSRKLQPTTSASQPARRLPNIVPNIHVLAISHDNEFLPLFAFPRDTIPAAKLAAKLVPPLEISPRFDHAILAQQKDREYSQLVTGSLPKPTVPPASHQPATSFRLDRDAMIALGTQCRAIVMAAERFEVDEDGVVTGDGCLLQRLWIPVLGEIPVFDWAHVAKRFAIAVTESAFGLSVPSPKAKKREAKKAASGDGGDGGCEKQDGGGDEDQQQDGEDGKESRGDKLDTGDHVDASPAVQGGASKETGSAARVFEKLVTVPELFVESPHLPNGWYSRDRQNVPAALRLFKKEVVDDVREQHPFTAEIVEAFGGMCDAWDSSHLSMAERHERINHFRRTFYPHIINAMCRPTGPPEYVCGWHRVTIEAMTNMAESLLLIDEEYVRRNGASPRLNWVQRAVGTDVLENTFSNERATLGLNPRAEANVTNHDEVKYAVGKTQYLMKVFADRIGALHDPGFKHRAAGHVKPIGDQADWGTSARLTKKLKRTRPSEASAAADENAAEGGSSGVEPAAKRRKPAEIKAKNVSIGPVFRARQHHNPRLAVRGSVGEAE